MEMMKDSSYWWWFDSHQHSSKRSPWLQSALGDLDRKTKTMLKLIEEDADSFAQRAEMYYKKRPELINIVGDFYKTHRSLAERYDLLKSESANRLLTTLGSPFSAKYQPPKLMDQFDQTFDSPSETGTGYPFSTKYQHSKLGAGEDQFDQAYDIRSENGTRASGYPFSTKYQQPNPMAGDDQFDQTYDSFSETGKRASGYPFSRKYQHPDPMVAVDRFDKNYDSFSETGTYDLEDTAESEVDDPDHDEETVDQNDMGEVEEPEHEVESDANEVVGLVYNDEVKKLQEEIERLREENRVQKEQLLQKDEEKREVIRQLSSAVEVLKAENEFLRKSVTRNSPKKKSIFEFEIIKDVFTGKIFSASARS